MSAAPLDVQLNLKITAADQRVAGALAALRDLLDRTGKLNGPELKNFTNALEHRHALEVKRVYPHAQVFEQVILLSVMEPEGKERPYKPRGERRIRDAVVVFSEKGVVSEFFSIETKKAETIMESFSKVPRGQAEVSRFVKTLGAQLALERKEVAWANRHGAFAAFTGTEVMTGHRGDLPLIPVEKFRISHVHRYLAFDGFNVKPPAIVAPAQLPPPPTAVPPTSAPAPRVSPASSTKVAPTAPAKGEPSGKPGAIERLTTTSPSTALDRAVPRARTFGGRGGIPTPIEIPSPALQQINLRSAHEGAALALYDKIHANLNSDAMEAAQNALEARLRMISDYRQKGYWVYAVAQFSSSKYKMAIVPDSDDYLIYRRVMISRAYIEIPERIRSVPYDPDSDKPHPGVQWVLSRIKTATPEVHAARPGWRAPAPTEPEHRELIGIPMLLQPPLGFPGFGPPMPTFDFPGDPLNRDRCTKD